MDHNFSVLSEHGDLLLIPFHFGLRSKSIKGTLKQKEFHCNICPGLYIHLKTHEGTELIQDIVLDSVCLKTPITTSCLTKLMGSHNEFLGSHFELPSHFLSRDNCRGLTAYTVCN